MNKTEKTTVTLEVPAWVLRDLKTEGQRFTVAGLWCAGAVAHAAEEEEAVTDEECRRACRDAVEAQRRLSAALAVQNRWSEQHGGEPVPEDV